MDSRRGRRLLAFPHGSEPLDVYDTVKQVQQRDDALLILIEALRKNVFQSRVDGRGFLIVLARR